MENLLLLWNEYLDKHNSKGVQSALKNAKHFIEGNSIHIHVPTTFIKELLLQESDLMEILRTSFIRDGIIIMIEINKSEFPEYEDASTFTPKLTTKEIYEKMKSKNPLLQDLINKLGLKPIDN
jgi:hypothetical protein